jgi:hypothetical protein
MYAPCALSLFAAAPAAAQALAEQPLMGMSGMVLLSVVTASVITGLLTVERKVEKFRRYRLLAVYADHVERAADNMESYDLLFAAANPDRQARIKDDIGRIRGVAARARDEIRQMESSAW